MITVAAVRTGQKYSLDYVERLFRAVRRNLTVEHDYLLLTDRTWEVPQVEGVLNVRRTHEPGWWAKAQLFEPASQGIWPLLFFDLDVVITGSLDELASYPAPLVAIQDWHLAKTLNSSVMRIEPGQAADVWSLYKVNPAEVQKRFRTGGDQSFITMVAGNRFTTWPGQWCRSYRSHCKDGPPEGCRVAVMHGSPKPHELTHLAWVREHWN